MSELEQALVSAVADVMADALDKGLTDGRSQLLAEVRDLRVAIEDHNNVQTLNVPQVTEALQVSLRTVAKYHSEGKIRFTRRWGVLVTTPRHLNEDIERAMDVGLDVSRILKRKKAS